MNAQDLIPEELVREALRPRRPDAAEFAEAVRRKAAEREAARRDADRRARERLSRSSFLRQAASLLPPVLLPKALVGAAGKQAAWKVGLSVVALPVFLLASMVATLVVAVRGTRGLDGTLAEDRILRRHQARAQHIALLLVGVVALVSMTGLHRGADLLLGLLFASMLAVLLVVRRLSRLGLASQRGVAAQCTGVLSSIAIWTLILGENSTGLASAEVQVTVVYLGLTVGGVACGVIGKWHFPEDRGATALAFTALGLIVALPVIAWLVLSTAELRSGASDAELAEYLEAFQDGAGQTPYWSDARDAALYLRDHGEGVPSLERAETVLRAALDEGGEAPSPFLLADAVDMGLLRPGDVLAVDTGRFRRQLLGKNGPIGSFDQYAAALWDLEVTGALDDTARDRLAGRVVATWFDTRNKQREDLEELCQIVRSLERLGRGARVEELRDDVLAFLSEAWIPPGEGRRPDVEGGFQDSFRALDFCDESDEGAAVWLMDRLGVPPGVDLAVLHVHLRREALRRGLWSDLDQFDLGPAATLARFEAAFGDRVPAAPFAVRLLGWRLLIGTLLLVGMCLYVTLRAPDEAPVTGP